MMTDDSNYLAFFRSIVVLYPDHIKPPDLRQSLLMKELVQEGRNAEEELDSYHELRVASDLIGFQAAPDCENGNRNPYLGEDPTIARGQEGYVSRKQRAPKSKIKMDC